MLPFPFDPTLFSSQSPNCFNFPSNCNHSPMTVPITKLKMTTRKFSLLMPFEVQAQ